MARRFVPNNQRQAGTGLVISFGALVVASVCGWSCASVLGIEDARCDPDFASDCAAQSAGGSGGGPSSRIGGLNVAGASSGGSAGASGSATASGGAAGSALAGAAGSAATTAAPPACRQYCDAVAADCTGPNAQFASPEACLAVCALLDPGTPGDTSGNTVECRLGRARLAASTGEPGNYCFSAGPGGAGICGSNCDGFCTLMTQNCTDLGDEDTCLQACAQVPDLSQEPAQQNYNASLQAGNSLQCRLFHVSAASVDPATHCVHAAGREVCK